MNRIASGKGVDHAACYGVNLAFPYLGCGVWVRGLGAGFGCGVWVRGLGSGFGFGVWFWGLGSGFGFGASRAEVRGVRALVRARVGTPATEPAEGACAPLLFRNRSRAPSRCFSSLQGFGRVCFWPLLGRQTRFRDRKCRGEVSAFSPQRLWDPGSPRLWHFKNVPDRRVSRVNSVVGRVQSLLVLSLIIHEDQLYGLDRLKIPFFCTNDQPWRRHA
jgi:hypothetical protein